MPLISPQPHSLSLPFPAHLPAEEGLLVVLRAALAGFLRVFPASLCPAAAGSLWLCGRPSQALIVRDLLHCLPQSPQARPACSTFVFPALLSPGHGELQPLCLPDLHGPSKDKAAGSPLLLLQGQGQAGREQIHQVCSSLTVRAGSPKDLNI